MSVNEQQYLTLMSDIMNNGFPRHDRTGVGTLTSFGDQFTFHITNSFPLLTTKTVPLRIIFEELKWFLSGSTKLRPLLLANVNIWNEWPFMAWLQRTNQPIPLQGSYLWKEMLKRFIERIKTDDEFEAIHGDLGDVYGKQWRRFTTEDGRSIDQIGDVIDLIKNDPDSRRIIVSGWNPGSLPDREMLGQWDKIIDNKRACLPPCHTMFQFSVRGKFLDCKLYQRSADIFLGVPFNIASYSLLVYMMAHQMNLIPGKFVHSFGDVHLYKNHIEAAKTQLTRIPKQMPTLSFARKPKTLYDYEWEDIVLTNYDPHPTINAPIAI